MAKSKPFVSPPIDLSLEEGNAKPAVAVESLTVGDAPVAAPPLVGWKVAVSVVLSNGQPIKRTFASDTEPTHDERDAFIRRAIEEFRDHLPDQIQFDNSAVELAVESPV